MYSAINSAVLDGLYGKSIKVETYIGNGIPGIKIIGLANATVTEAKERIRAASKITNIKLPNRKIIVNLSPANIKKEGSQLDLPILCGIYLAAREEKIELPDNIGFLGEIGLNGEIKSFKGILNMMIELQNSGVNKIVIPNSDIIYFEIDKGLSVIPTSHVSEVIELIDSNFNESCIKKLQSKYMDIRGKDPKNIEINDEDFSDVNGQNDVKRIMQIAAAGGHNVLLLGEPGIGKSMCVSRIKTIMPKLTKKEQLECMLIKSSTGIDEILDSDVPIRSPYKTVTESSMFGGGQRGKVGEVTMAHNGILILDEMLEFNKKIIDGFRQPLEENRIRISRINGNYDYPCKFILIGTANPCPCGYYGGSKACNCSDVEIKKYIKKLSGPILDRIDITYLMNRDIFDKSPNITSSELKEKVIVARKKQFKRYLGDSDLNSNVKIKVLQKTLHISNDAIEILEMYSRQFNISNRGYNKIIRLSRTIADLEGRDNISVSDVSEALNYRFFDEFFNSN